MRNLPQLMDAVYEAFLKAQEGEPWHPKKLESGEVVTYCNEALNHICKRVGFNGFDKPTTQNPTDAILANQMYEYMDQGKESWRRVDNARGAQRLANAGALVCAAWKNYNGAHGHVCIVIPGTVEYSGSWQAVAPKIMNVGTSVFIGKKASFAFSRDKMPSYFVWEGPS